MLWNRLLYQFYESNGTGTANKIFSGKFQLAAINIRMNRCQTKNGTEVPSHFMDVARILVYAADRPALPPEPPRPHTQKVDNPTGYSQNSMV